MNSLQRRHEVRLHGLQRIVLRGLPGTRGSSGRKSPDLLLRATGRSRRFGPNPNQTSAAISIRRVARSRFFVDSVATCPPGARRRVAAGSECAEYRNFLREHSLPPFTPPSAPEGFVNCVIRGNRALPFLRASLQPSWVQRMIVIQSSMRRMCTAAGLASSSPDRSVDTAEPSAIAAGSRGLSQKISILSASATCSHSSTASVRANRRPAATKSAMNRDQAGT
jgi:hypothetical protein